MREENEVNMMLKERERERGRGGERRRQTHTNIQREGEEIESDLNNNTIFNTKDRNPSGRHDFPCKRNMN
jgi:hypothetical protein